MNNVPELSKVSCGTVEGHGSVSDIQESLTSPRATSVSTLGEPFRSDREKRADLNNSTQLMTNRHEYSGYQAPPAGIPEAPHNLYAGLIERVNRIYDRYQGEGELWDDGQAAQEMHHNITGKQ